MHPDDLRALATFMRQGAAKEPASSPPGSGRGSDSAIYRELELMLDRKIDGLCKELLLKCEERFLSIFSDLEMPMRSEEQRVKTRKKMGQVFALVEIMQDWKKEFLGKFIQSTVAWVITAISVGAAVFFAKGGWH